ncbi:MAG: AAA family ATPase [Proteobacteria bacterium]|nr:AAA family ATPase [Pseudomonadota bacterium]MBI3496680.1 AAA family ATPase [Pseudomonadota bacterium]
MAAEYNLAGYVNARGKIPAIFVPVFSARENNDSFIQACGIDNTIIDFDVLVPNDWECIESQGAPLETPVVTPGEEILCWVALEERPRGHLVGRYKKVQSQLLTRRSLIARIDSPFERLDFAQLAGDPAWFEEEGVECERTLVTGGASRRLKWLQEAILQSRALFALHAILRQRGLPSAARHQVATNLSLFVTDKAITFNQSKLTSALGHAPLQEDDLQRFHTFLQTDLVCCYARRRILADPTTTSVTATSARTEPLVSAPPSPIVAPPAVSSGWWRAASDLDEDQTRAFRWPLDGNYLLVGPPGSGKSNILVLRASYVASTGQSNVRLLTYTRVLREFIASGCGDYINFPEDQVMTIAGWINQFLDERGFPRPDTRDYDEPAAWAARLLALKEAAEGVSDYYDSLIVDEVQDLPGEVLTIMSRLTTRLYMAGDVRQRIFEKDAKDSGIRAAENIADEVVRLRWHYRIGPAICRSADRILPSEEPLIDTCKYNSALGSRVEVHQGANLESQCSLLARTLDTQLRTYGNEALGVITGRRETRDFINTYLSDTPLGTQTKVMSSGTDEPWYDPVRPICIMTIQAAKGSEFRAVHWVQADDTPYFTREKAYVVSTRAKTALDVYHSRPLPAVLNSAFSQLRPPRSPF